MDYGGFIKLDGVPVGMFLEKAYPETPGDYPYMPVRSVGHYNMGTAVRSGRIPRCTWARGSRSASFDIVAIPRYGVLSIDNVVVRRSTDPSRTGL